MGANLIFKKIFVKLKKMCKIPLIFTNFTQIFNITTAFLINIALFILHIFKKFESTKRSWRELRNSCKTNYEVPKTKTFCVNDIMMNNNNNLGAAFISKIQSMY